MARPRIDFLARVTPLLTTLDPDECWDWLGPVSRCLGGATRKDGLQRRVVSYAPELVGGRLRTNTDLGPDLRFKSRGDYIRVKHRTVLPNISHPPISYMGEVIALTAALYHHFKQPTLYGYLPCKQERLIKRTYLLNVKRGASPPHPMFEDHEALSSMFEGVKVRRALSCPDPFKRKFPNGLFCCNPFHARMFIPDEKKPIADDRLLTTKLFAPADYSSLETPDIVADLMFEWLDDLATLSIPKFLELFKTEDRSDGLFTEALTILVTQRDIARKWKLLLTPLCMSELYPQHTPTV